MHGSMCATFLPRADKPIFTTVLLLAELAVAEENPRFMTIYKLPIQMPIIILKIDTKWHHFILPKPIKISCFFYNI